MKGSVLIYIQVPKSQISHGLHVCEDIPKITGGFTNDTTKQTSNSRIKQLWSLIGGKIFEKMSDPNAQV